MAAAVKSLPIATGDTRDAVGHFRGDAEDLPHPPPSVTPIFGATVASDRPALAWRATKEAGSYRVRLIAGTGRELWQAAAEGQRLAYPEGEPSLLWGYLYRWEVSEGAGRVLVRSEFTVATRSEAERMERVLPLARGSDAADLLGAALVYARLRAWDEALAAFERLDRLRPSEPAVRDALDGLHRRAGQPGNAEIPR